MHVALLLTLATVSSLIITLEPVATQPVENRPANALWRARDDLPPPGATTMYPSDDSFVDRERIAGPPGQGVWVNSSDWNYGNRTYLTVVTTKFDDRDRRTFLKFALSSLPSPEGIDSVKLFLFKNDRELSLPGSWISAVGNVEAREVHNDSWTEMTVTWNNHPACDGLLDAVYVPLGGTKWYSWDVTPFILNELAGDKVASICLKAENEDQGDTYRYSYFWSKEHGSLKPHLLVAYESEPVPIDGQAVSLKLSGEHDYLFEEDIKIRLTALVNNASTKEPVSDANVAVEIYYPNGTLWVSDVMVERLANTGIYEWESSDTIQTLHLEKGVYLVRVHASYQGGPTAFDILQFHIDPRQEPLGAPMLYVAAVTAAVLVGVAGVIIYRWSRPASRRPHVE